MGPKFKVEPHPGWGTPFNMEGVLNQMYEQGWEFVGAIPTAQPLGASMLVFRQREAPVGAVQFSGPGVNMAGNQAGMPAGAGVSLAPKAT